MIFLRLMTDLKTRVLWVSIPLLIFRLHPCVSQVVTGTPTLSIRGNTHGWIKPCVRPVSNSYRVDSSTSSFPLRPRRTTVPSPSPPSTSCFTATWCFKSQKSPGFTLPNTAPSRPVSNYQPMQSHLQQSSRSHTVSCATLVVPFVVPVESSQVSSVKHGVILDQ